MRIKFVKRECCTEAGKIVAYVEGNVLSIIAHNLIKTCSYDLGDNCYVTVYDNLKQLEDEFGEDIPEGAKEAIRIAEGGIMLSSNGCSVQILSLPMKNTKEYYQAIIDNLTSYDWGDCDVVITGKIKIS